jgi:glucose/arabinose dehydrogenase
MKIFTPFLLLALWVALPLTVQSQITIGSTQVDTQSVATGLDTPWEILWGPDDHIWMTERYGRVSRLNPETGERQTLVEIDQVHEQGESGLLGMALHPDFQNTPHVYLVYNYLSGSSIRERLVRYRYDQGSLSSPTVLLEGIDGSSIHNGARLVIDSLERLYFTTGDAGNTAHSQDLNSLNGKILRLNLDGSIPGDNPFQDSYIYTYGHRNPQGLVISPEGIIYSSEHGPASDDEMNIIEKGRNYGWPDVMGYCDDASETTFCEENNVKEPIAAWTPTLAVAGTGFYSSTAIPEWTNSLLMTTLKESELVQLKLSQDGREVMEEQVWFDEWFGRLRDVAVAPDGRVFVAVSNRDGRGDPRPGDDRIVEFSPSEATDNAPTPDEGSSLQVYPNPFTDALRLEVPGGMTGGKLSLYDSNGRLVKRQLANSPVIMLNTRNLSPGIYLLVMQKDNKRISRKVVLKK